jgi:hypothetical protein
MSIGSMNRYEEGFFTDERAVSSSTTGDAAETRGVSDASGTS